MGEQALTYQSPGVGGMVTDEPPHRLKAGQSPYMRNVILTRQVAAERNGWGRTGATNPFGAGAAGQIEGAMAVQFDQASDAVTIVITQEGKYGRVVPSSSSLTDSLNLTAALPRAFYQGEVIFCPTDGISPIRRGANSWAARQTMAGHMILTKGSNLVSGGGGPNFLTTAPVGSYVPLGDYPARARVVSVQSNSVMSIDTPAPETLNTISESAPFGLIGLATEVTRQGEASLTSFTTLAGTGTGWTLTRRGVGRVAIGDGIAPVTGATREVRVAAVNSDTSITTTTANSSWLGDWTIRPTVIYRPLVGREACVHNNSLFVAGVQWAPRRLYVLPAGKPLGQVFNDEDSYDVNRGAARLAKFTDVPGPDTAGHIEALLSSPGPLLVLGTDGAYGNFGFYPDDQIELMADGAGCLDLRSACSGEPGQAWCGPEGIYLYRRGRIEDLTEGRRNREWRRLMNARDKANSYVCAGFYGDKLVVAVTDGPGRTVKVQDYLQAESTSQTWSYDFGVEAWDGLHSGIRARYLATSQLPGQSDELFMVSDESLAATPVNQIATLGTAWRDEANGPTTNREGLVIELPGNAEGGSLTALGRMTKVRLALEVDQGTNTTLALSTTDQPDLETDASRSVGVGQATGAGVVIYERFRPQTDVTGVAITRGLGTSRRTQHVRLTRTGVQPNALRIHEVEITSRQRTRRG